MDDSTINSQIGFLPLDLIIQILSRLPSKSLVKFKSVCKSWYLLISSTHFTQLHFRFSSQTLQLVIQPPDPTDPNSEKLLFIDSSTPSSNLSLDFVDDCIKVRASSNGILCCSSVKNKGVYYVCNPITREYRILPRTRDRPFTRTQPFYEATLVGLCFNPISFKFTVVLAGFYRSFGQFRGNQFVSNVFYSETNSWKRFEFPLIDEFTHMNRNQAVHDNCSIYWLTQSCTHLLYFDSEIENWGKIALPGEILGTQNGSRVYLLEYEGHVSVIQISQGVMSTFVMKDRNLEKWYLLDQVKLNCIGCFANSGIPVGQNRCFVFLAAQRNVLAYDRRSRVWKEAGSSSRCSSGSMYPLWFSAFPFKGSLFPCKF
ncbi:F-box protein [Rhynchospora pubera]|uniref:F-box protein n=1 Tax=Rhynchospora pubera TaxID=906938 RepID=A0AAV8HSE5_9POAL|nr:F-box protein [Rhynchospora pubera]